MKPSSDARTTKEELDFQRARLQAARAYLAEVKILEEQGRLIPIEMVHHQAIAIFTACRQKLRSIPSNVSRSLVGKDHKTIHDALTREIHKTLREMADFHKKVVNPDWNPEDRDDGVPPLIDPPQIRQSPGQSKSESPGRRSNKGSS
jgi:phage terminase Nu1 subunit (DNA packaging protein)